MNNQITSTTRITVLRTAYPVGSGYIYLIVATEYIKGISFVYEAHALVGSNIVFLTAARCILKGYDYDGKTHSEIHSDIATNEVTMTMSNKLYSVPQFAAYANYPLLDVSLDFFIRMRIQGKFENQINLLSKHAKIEDAKTFFSNMLRINQCISEPLDVDGALNPDAIFTEILKEVIPQVNH